MRRAHVLAAVLAAGLLAGSPAAAHTPITGGVGFVGGLLHPVAVPAHLLAIAGLAVVIGGAPQGRAALATMFALGLAAGLVAIALASGPSSAPLVLMAAAIVSGVSAALARAWPPLIGWPLAAVTGAAIGLDSPPDVASLDVANRMLIGTGLGAAALLVATAAVVAALSARQPIALRIAGSWVAASAILVLALQMAR